MSLPLRRARAAAPAALAALLLLAHLHGWLELLLPVVPLLLLLCSLMLDLYPGCEALVRLSDRLAARCSRKAARARPAPPRGPRRAAAHGGLLLGLSLSGRAPPAAA